MSKPTSVVQRRMLSLLLLVVPALAAGATFQSAGKGSIEGVVTRAGTSEPLVGARVLLIRLVPGGTPAGTPVGSVVSSSGGVVSRAPLVAASPEAPTPNSPAATPAVATDAAGRFAFKDVDAGVYRINVMANGYARQEYGQRTLFGPVTPLQLTAGQLMKNANISLTPAGNVSGRVRDISGLPLVGVPVQLLRVAYNAEGRRTFQPAGTARTNDRGEYRLYWVTPGRYYLSAGTSTGPDRPPEPAGAAVSLNEIPAESYGLAFYPGVADVRSAALIDVRPSDELNDMDISAVRQQLRRVTGHVIDSRTGRPPAAVSVSLAYRTLSGGSGAFSSGFRYDPATGVFELRNVPPGAYVAQAAIQDSAPAGAGEAVLRVSTLAGRASARLPIQVVSEDVTGVMLVLADAASISGRLSIESVAPSPVALPNALRVQINPLDDGVTLPVAMQPVSQPVSRDGSFRIDGVFPGEFLLGPVTGLPQGFYVKEARYGLFDAFEQPIAFSDSNATTTSLEILVSSRAGQVEGTVIDARSRPAAGAAVVLVPDRQRNRPEFYRTVASDASGRFSLRSVAPGAYRVFAWEAIDSFAYFDPEFIIRMEPRGTPVRVAEAATVTIGILVIPQGQ